MKGCRSVEEFNNEKRSKIIFYTYLFKEMKKLVSFSLENYVK